MANTPQIESRYRVAITKDYNRTAVNSHIAEAGGLLVIIIKVNSKIYAK